MGKPIEVVWFRLEVGIMVSDKVSRHDIGLPNFLRICRILRQTQRQKFLIATGWRQTGDKRQILRRQRQRQIQI